MQKKMFSHLDSRNTPHMVNISGKKRSHRTAAARTEMELGPLIMQQFADGEIQSPKGPVLNTAVIAGIQAVKNTPGLIPLCHTVPVSHCSITMDLNESGLSITCTVQSDYATGVEIEAITGCSIAAITIYDMCKSIDSTMIIRETRLLYKDKT